MKVAIFNGMKGILPKIRGGAGRSSLALGLYDAPMLVSFQLMNHFGGGGKGPGYL
jgi:hypothetical protein